MTRSSRRNATHTAIHATAVSGLLLVAAAGLAVHRPTLHPTASIAIGLLLLMASHVLVALEIRRFHHSERALRSTTHELETFSFSVSHDLRAPLRSIEGFGQALLEDAGSALPPEAIGHLERIRSATRQMGRLIDDLLILSKVGQAEMKEEQVDLHDVASQIVEELRRRAPARTVDVTVAADLMATGDTELVRLALHNLLENAWKFTSRREQASIEVGRVRGDGGTPAFYVRDNGAGFDPHYADHLFGPFQRLHPASEFPGIGIGLATVQRVIHRHGGQVWADAGLDRGACFYFTLG